MSVVVPRAQQELCHVLREDSDLGAAIPPERRERAVEECVVRVARLPCGVWTERTLRTVEDGIGLLVLEGLLIRRVGIDGRFGAELLGESDLLRPWHGEDGSPTLALTTGWRVLQPARLAVLDERAMLRLAPYPRVSARLIGRAIQRSRNLAVNMAIVHQARVDVRLHMLLWHLAARWGRVRAEGVLLPLRLTHSTLADLVAARRPTVTSALAGLGKSGLVQSVPEGWLLTGEPPGELLELTSRPVSPPES
jgi:hypothetical protein